jgi:aldehyde dehydrogenase (NAD+)
MNHFILYFSLAPDYILCSKATENRLVPEIVKAWQLFYTDNPLTSDSYCHIINERHFERVNKLIDTTKVVYGGQTDAKQNYISPTIMYLENLTKNFYKIFCLFLLLGPM